MQWSWFRNSNSYIICGDRAGLGFLQGTALSLTLLLSSSSIPPENKILSKLRWKSSMELVRPQKPLQDLSWINTSKVFITSLLFPSFPAQLDRNWSSLPWFGKTTLDISLPLSIKGWPGLSAIHYILWEVNNLLKTLNFIAAIIIIMPRHEMKVSNHKRRRLKY